MEINIDDLKRSNEFLNALYNNVTSAIFIADRGPRIHHFNDSFKTLFYKPEDQILMQLCGNAMGCIFTVKENRDCGSTSNCDKCELRAAVVTTFGEKAPVFKRKMVRDFVINGKEMCKHFIFSTRYMEHLDGDMILIIVDDVSDMEKARLAIEERNSELARQNLNLEKLISETTARLIELNRELAGEKKNRNTLIQEVQHRVGNNLQIISSLMNLQANNLQGTDIYRHFREVQSRIEAIKLLHLKLFDSDFASMVDIDDYLTTLARDIFARAGEQAKHVDFERDIDKLRFDIDTALPLGLIVNECLSNALMHAFPDGRPGTVSVSLKHSNGKGFQLTVADDGIGMKDGSDSVSASRLGLRLITALADQLRGELFIRQGNGLEFSVVFSGAA